MNMFKGFLFCLYETQTPKTKHIYCAALMEVEVVKRNANMRQHNLCFDQFLFTCQPHFSINCVLSDILLFF